MDTEALLSQAIVNAHETHRKYAEETEKRIRNNLPAMLKLQQIGLMSEISVSNISYGGPDVYIEPEQLPLLRTVFDTVKDTGDYNIYDVERELIKVKLDLGVPEPNSISVYYTKHLSAYDKCKIVRETSTYTSLVCER